MQEFAKRKKEEKRGKTGNESHYKIEQNLQRFSQICVSALKANTAVSEHYGRVFRGVMYLSFQLTEVATVAMADGHHHISDFFLDCHSNTQVSTMVYW